MFGRRTNMIIFWFLSRPVFDVTAVVETELLSFAKCETGNLFMALF